VLIVGGFGNITKGEMDFWNIEADGTVGQKEIGKGKHSCATKIDWSACGRYVLTSVLNERLKVDNGFQIFRGNGTAVLEAPLKFAELHSVTWRPHQKGVLARPKLSEL
jgi:translation initiation factor 2A